MAAFAALLLLLGAMFGGALVVDGWRAKRLRAWALARGFGAVDSRTDGGALIGHATRFSRRVRSFGLAFHQATAADEVWLAEHRALLTARPVEKWFTLVVVRVPGADLAAPSSDTLASWPHGGDVAAEGDVVRWRRQGLLWPGNVDDIVSRGRELAARISGAAR